MANRKIKDGKSKAFIDMNLSTFKIPPSGDVLVLGKSSPLGPKAAKQMLDTVAPDQFELHLTHEDEIIDGILFRSYLCLRIDKEAFIKVILDESKPIMSKNCMIAINCDISLSVTKEIP